MTKPKAGPHGGTLQYWTRVIVAKHPELTLEQVIERVHKKTGRKPSLTTARDSRIHMLRDMATLRDLGMLRDGSKRTK
jgi:hypothetical protein